MDPWGLATLRKLMEPRSLDSESIVLAVTPGGRLELAGADRHLPATVLASHEGGEVRTAERAAAVRNGHL